MNKYTTTECSCGCFQVSPSVSSAGKSLGRYTVPIQNEGFSFLGVVFNAPVVARVRIEYGSAPLGKDDGPDNDVAVMDDFIYGEPQPIKAPSSSTY